MLVKELDLNRRRSMSVSLDEKELSSIADAGKFTVRKGHEMEHRSTQCSSSPQVVKNLRQIGGSVACINSE